MTDVADDMPPSRIWPALLWTLAGMVAFGTAQVLGLLVFIVWTKLVHPGMPIDLHGLMKNGVAISVVIIMSSLLSVLFCLGFARIRTRAVRLYLGLRWPTFRYFLIGLASLGALLALMTVLAKALDDPRAANFMRDLFLSARTGQSLVLLAFAVTVAGPIGEDIMFRGFFYKTIKLRFGVIAAILITSAGWAVLHLQYSLISMAVIFAVGLLLGTIRYYSRSLLLTMILHGVWNTLSLIGSATLISKP